MKKTPTWKLALSCAQALTAEGSIPFTRKQLIECIRFKDPNRMPGTINPTIQGMTVNLRGGPPGLGRGSLRTVGRGQFVLTAPNEAQLEPLADGGDSEMATHTAQPSDMTDGPCAIIGGVEFRKIIDFDLDREPDGSIRLFEPQSRYDNYAGLKLNRYGSGPFCRFKIPSDLPLSGVYAILRNEIPIYVGECENLSRRFNYGYGLISPRNCFKRGQETNCRINGSMLREIQAGHALHLYFHPCECYKQLEAQLRRDLTPQWNLV